MRLFTLPGVFKPRNDGRLLAQVAGGRAAGRSVLDLFTGSGVVAVASALAGARSVSAVDVSWRAALTVRLNARLNRTRVEALRGDLLAPVGGRRFELITANPPYLPGEELPRRGPARAWEGGRDGRLLIDRLCREAPVALAPGGRMMVVHSSVNGVERTVELLAEQGLRAQVVARHRGPLGPLLAARQDRLDAAGLGGGGGEELVVIEARWS